MVMADLSTSEPLAERLRIRATATPDRRRTLPVRGGSAPSLRLSRPAGKRTKSAEKSSNRRKLEREKVLRLILARARFSISRVARTRLCRRRRHPLTGEGKRAGSAFGVPDFLPLVGGWAAGPAPCPRLRGRVCCPRLRGRVCCPWGLGGRQPPHGRVAPAPRYSPSPKGLMRGRQETCAYGGTA